jgi:hypothetical protein
MTGHKIHLPRNVLKDGKITKAQPRSVSDKIRQRKSNRVRVQKRTT